MDEKIATAMRHYQNQRKAAKAYNERNRQAKKEAGIYRGPGRPKKNPDAVVSI